MMQRASYRTGIGHTTIGHTASATWATMAVQLDQRLGARLKRAMIAMLAAWLGYFVLISMSVRTLNKMTVPLLNMQLGLFLVAQGTAIIFCAALILLVPRFRH
jgi:uncharacterized membrane protein